MRAICSGAALVLLTGCAPVKSWRWQDWSGPSKVAFAASVACHVVDNLQTEAWLDDESGKHREGLPISGLGGKYPNDTQLWGRDALWIGGTYYLATTVEDTAPRFDRTFMIAALSAPCLVQIIESHRMGIRINFGGNGS